MKASGVMALVGLILVIGSLIFMFALEDEWSHEEPTDCFDGKGSRIDGLVCYHSVFDDSSYDMFLGVYIAGLCLVLIAFLLWMREQIKGDIYDECD